jgi:hypothetical protein
MVPASFPLPLSLGLAFPFPLPEMTGDPLPSKVGLPLPDTDHELSSQRLILMSLTNGTVEETTTCVDSLLDRGGHDTDGG